MRGILVLLFVLLGVALAQSSSGLTQQQMEALRIRAHALKSQSLEDKAGTHRRRHERINKIEGDDNRQAREVAALADQQVR